MANHLTPEELSKEIGIERQEVIRVCVEEGVPIYQGKIDKTLFQAQLQAMGAPDRRLAPPSRRPTALLLARRRVIAPAAFLARRASPSASRRRAPRSTLRAERLHEVDDRRLLNRLRRA